MQQIAFPIKGYALLRFELSFRIFRKDLQQYIDEIGPDYPMATFYVYENRITMFVEVEDLCDSQPLTVKFTAASAVHDQTYRKVRDVMSIVDDVYDRILTMHMERYDPIKINHREHLELPDGTTAQ